MKNATSEEAQRNQRENHLCNRVVEMLTELPEVKGVGLAGSHVLGEADEFSDLDLQAFTEGDAPEPARRKAVYEATPGIEVGPLEHVVSEESVGSHPPVRFVVDWLRVDGTKCDVLWLRRDGLETTFRAIADDPLHPEAAAALAVTIRPLHDPHGLLRGLIERCPPYTEDRARSKAMWHMRSAHFMICGWGVLAKTLRRGDLVAYQQAEAQMVQHLVSALYAVNRTWQLDMRRLRFHSRSFEVLPPRMVDRLEAMIRREGACRALDVCHRELRALFRDLAVAANGRFPAWGLPTDWPEWAGGDGMP